MGIVLVVAGKVFWNHVSLRSAMVSEEQRLVAYSLLTTKAVRDIGLLRLTDGAPQDAMRRFELPWRGDTIYQVLTELDPDCTTIWFGRVPLPGGGSFDWSREALLSPNGGFSNPELARLASFLQKTNKGFQDFSKNDQRAPNYCEYRIQFFPGTNVYDVLQAYSFLIADAYVDGSHRGYTVVREPAVYFAEDVQWPGSNQQVMAVPNPGTAGSLASAILLNARNSGVAADDPRNAYALLKSRWLNQSVTIPVLNVEMPFFVAVFALQWLSLAQLLMLNNVLREAIFLKQRGRSEPWAVLAMTDSSDALDRFTVKMTSGVALLGFWLFAAAPVLVGVMAATVLILIDRPLQLVALPVIALALAIPPLWRSVRGSLSLSRDLRLREPRTDKASA